MYNIENYKTYLDKLKGYYDDRDISHGWNHVLQVCKNSLLISQYENITNINKLNIIVICSLGHDIWDHKYVDNSELLKEVGFRNIKIYYHWLGLSKITDFMFGRNSYRNYKYFLYILPP